jgi:probable rRNA maturation factor
MRVIDISNQVGEFIFAPSEVEALFHFLDAWDGLPRVAPGELSVVFLTDQQICELHGRFLDDPSPTDVITFPGTPEEDFAGEICVSPGFAGGSSRQHGQTFSREVALYLVHGWLHLAGFSDLQPEAIPAMRAAEKSCLEALEQAACLPHFTWKDAAGKTVF